MPVKRIIDHVAHFWDRVERGEPDECWPWQGAVLATGYGVLTTLDAPSRTRTAHRHAWFLTNGPLQRHQPVWQSCRNLICCNPDHLVIKRPDGMSGRRGRISDDQVRGIRKAMLSNVSIYDVARWYGISEVYVKAICAGQVKRGVDLLGPIDLKRADGKSYRRSLLSLAMNPAPKQKRA